MRRMTGGGMIFLISRNTGAALAMQLVRQVSRLTARCVEECEGDLLPIPAGSRLPYDATDGLLIGLDYT